MIDNIDCIGKMSSENKDAVKYSFIMAPFYLIGDDDLLKTQLLSLNMQTFQSFEVVIPDPHYKKRPWLIDFCKENLKYNVKHFKFSATSIVPKSFDYGILNDAVLMSEGEKIITYQDWRFCNHRLLETIDKFENCDYVGFRWQILYLEDGTSPISAAHSKSTIDICLEDSNIMMSKGIFPDMEMEIDMSETFSCASWGHYCIKRSLWLDVNGIDEVATNTRHYADLDLEARLQYFYKSNNIEVKIPIIKNAMVRIMHYRGNFFGGSNIEIDEPINQSHKSCCFVKTGEMNDREFTLYVLEKIDSGDFSKLYSQPYSEGFILNNKNEKLDHEHSIIGFQCNKCKVIGETPHWYDKNSDLRTAAMKKIGIYPHIIGRDLKEIDSMIRNKDFNEKAAILNSSRN